MKKHLTLLTLILMSGVAHADFWSNCIAYGGTIITANKYGTDANGNNLDKGGLCNDPNDTNLTNNCNGKKFCRSKNIMNWWSCFNWCDSIGGNFVPFERACPGTQQNPKQGGGACHNLIAVDTEYAHWGWVNMAWGNNQGVAIYLPNGAMESRARSQASNGGYALCEEK